MLSRLRTHLPAWRRALRRRRRLLAALAVAAIVAAVLPSLLPPSARGVQVVVAEVALDPGTVLTASHVGTARIDADLVPAGAAHQVDEVLGRTARVPLEAGAPLLPGVLDPADAAAVPEGWVLMVVPVPAALTPHLPPGTGIELLSTDPTLLGGSGVRARVLRVVPGGAGGSALSGTAGTSEALVVVERSRAGEVAHALGVGAVMVTVIG